MIRYCQTDPTTVRLATLYRLFQQYPQSTIQVEDEGLVLSIQMRPALDDVEFLGRLIHTGDHAIVHHSLFVEVDGRLIDVDRANAFHRRHGTLT